MMQLFIHLYWVSCFKDIISHHCLKSTPNNIPPGTIIFIENSDLKNEITDLNKKLTKTENKNKENEKKENKNNENTISLNIDIRLYEKKNINLSLKKLLNQ